MQENYIVGIYARLSRDDERAGESVSIENQKEITLPAAPTRRMEKPVRLLL